MEHSLLPQMKPTLETEKSICEDVSSTYSISPKYLTVNPFYENNKMIRSIYKEMNHIHNLIQIFKMNVGMYKRYLNVDFLPKLMKVLNEQFSEIYKILSLTYKEPTSAFELDISDMSWYCEITKSYNLENTNAKDNLTSIFEILLEMGVLIDALNLEIQDKFDTCRKRS